MLIIIVIIVIFISIIRPFCFLFAFFSHNLFIIDVHHEVYENYSYYLVLIYYLCTIRLLILLGINRLFFSFEVSFLNLGCEQIIQLFIYNFMNENTSF